jgi:hypothetical protein
MIDQPNSKEVGMSNAAMATVKWFISKFLRANASVSQTVLKGACPGGEGGLSTPLLISPGSWNSPPTLLAKVKAYISKRCNQLKRKISQRLPEKYMCLKI